ncbi:MAG: hypothetical protein ACPGLV_18705 [Bacteroidia bacterium]
MKFIKPSEISSKIMTMIDETDEFLYLVSPYIKIAKWYKLINKFNRLKERNIPFKFFVRDDNRNSESKAELKNLKYDFTALQNLHTKLYINENYAIVTSMNLLLSSEINSIEIGYRTENDSEYQELKEYCKRYLNIDFESHIKTLNNRFTAFDEDEELGHYILDIFATEIGETTKLSFNSENINIKTRRNNYYVSFEKNELSVDAILAQGEVDFLKQNHDYLKFKDDLAFKLIDNARSYSYIQVWQRKDYDTSDIYRIPENSKYEIADVIAAIVCLIDNFKQEYYTSLRHNT